MSPVEKPRSVTIRCAWSDAFWAKYRESILRISSRSVSSTEGIANAFSNSICKGDSGVLRSAFIEKTFPTKLVIIQPIDNPFAMDSIARFCAPERHLATPKRDHSLKNGLRPKEGWPRFLLIDKLRICQSTKTVWIASINSRRRKTTKI